VADEIRAGGGTAVACVGDVRDGVQLRDAALAAFGRIDALLCNAGHVRDRSFSKMTDEEWSDVLAVHLDGTRAAVKAVWPWMAEHRYGRIVLTSSSAGLHGNFGQANYAAAKAAIAGLGKTLAREGKRDGILVNVLAPIGWTTMNDGLFDARMKDRLTVEKVAPFAAALCDERLQDTGLLIEAGGGWAAALRWERSVGLRLDDQALSTDRILDQWSQITQFEHGAEHPRSAADAVRAALGDAHKKKSEEP
jgi:NAD(P)-dependent dehydrogenase (short-subunit alcohol dehydrogenase family)